MVQSAGRTAPPGKLIAEVLSVLTRLTNVPISLKVSSRVLLSLLQLLQPQSSLVALLELCKSFSLLEALPSIWQMESVRNLNSKNLLNSLEKYFDDLK
jgi:hypothetical protein